jgi:hypothetical protein
LAFFIDAAVLRFFAFEGRVTGKSWRTVAMCMMVFGYTVRVSSASSTDGAGILATFLVASLIDWAVVISATSFEALMSFTDVPKVTVGVHSTFNLENTAARITRPIVTALIGSDTNIGIVDAFEEGISNTLGWTGTGKSMGFGNTDGIETTGSNKHTGVLTLATDAAMIILTGGVRATPLIASVILTDSSNRAFRIDYTLDLGAFNLWVTSVSRLTCTVASVIDRFTLGVWPTCSG